jgi:hypothetical protein
MSRRIKVLGQDNFVDSSADRILVIGNNNQVFGKVENVVIVGDNQTVEESNVVVIDGDVKRFNYSGAGNRLIWTDAANYNTDANTTYYLADSSGGNIVFTLSANDADYYPGMEFNFKKLTASNVVLINAGAKTIDGLQYVPMYAEGDAVRIIYDGFNYHKLNQSADDYHSGYNKITSVQTVRIAQRKQMTNHGGLTISGVLIIDGDLILK